MEQPCVTWPVIRASEWVEELRRNGISVCGTAPLSEQLAELRQKGINMPSPSERELALCTSVVCRRGLGEVSVVGSLSKDLNPEQYLISLFWKSGWKRAKHPNSLLASEILQVLMNAGATTYDPWNQAQRGHDCASSHGQN